MTKADVAKLARPSGAFAMLAIDQRESMRAMFAERIAGPVSDQQISDFKIAALKVLTPEASAVLIDRQFCWDRAITERAVASSCSLISAADHFSSVGDEIVGKAVIDPKIDARVIREQGGAALKLLIVYRPDQASEARVAMADKFISMCRAAELVSLIEPVSRRRLDGQKCDIEEGIYAAAKELGSRGANIYKAEVPLHGEGTEAEIRSRCERLTASVTSPWVVLSSGIDPNHFPLTVEWACKGGAAGFLAGRAVWRDSIGAPDLESKLRNDALDRMKRLSDVVEKAVA